MLAGLLYFDTIYIEIYTKLKVASCCAVFDFLALRPKNKFNSEMIATWVSGL